MELPGKPIALPKPADRQKWLAERRKGVGGSDAAAAIGLSKWMTPLELWLDKRGELIREETSSMRWGITLEPIVRQEYCNQTGAEVLVPEAIYQHSQHAFAIINLDGLVLSRDRIYEGKTSRTGEGWGEPGTDEVPPEYNLQVQHGMAITGLPMADIAVLIGGSDFRIYCVEADLDLQQMMLEREAEFWQMVVDERPPEPTTPADVKLRWKMATAGKQAEADMELANDCLSLRDLKDALKAGEAQKESLEAKLQTAMMDAAELVWNGETLATWKNVNANPRFDLERFKAEQSELYQQYLQEPAASRRFLLKVKG